MKTLRIATILTITALMAGGLQAGSIYTVVPFSVPSGATAITGGPINNSGQAAGSVTYGSTKYAAVLTTAGDGTYISNILPDGMSPGAHGINDSGQVTGRSSSGQAFIGSGGSATLIPLPSGSSFSDGWSINASGDVVGYMGTSNGRFQGFVGTTSGTSFIPLPSGTTHSQATAISDNGLIAGQALGPSNWQAFVGTASGVTPIDLPSGYSTADTNSYGLDINDAGTVVGYIYNSSVGAKAMIGNASGSSLLPVTASYSVARSINAAGDVVGDGGSGGWIYSSTTGIVTTLNSLVPTGWTVGQVYGINDVGQIAALGSFQGGASQFVLLTTEVATPEPATLLMAGTALAGLGLMRRRKSKA